jgi:hypothetical protein
MVKSFFGILSFVLSFGVTIPYAVGVVKGRVKLARSTRMLFLFLMLVTLVVQGSEFTGWVLLLTVGEVLSQVLLFVLAIRYGIGGLARFDIICYVAFAVSLSAYLATKDAVLSLTLLILTDMIGFAPTLLKNWRDPVSDSWLFFVVGGVGAAAASLLARSSNAYAEIGFPAYILVANALAALPLLIDGRKRRRKRDGLGTISQI